MQTMHTCEPLCKTCDFLWLFQLPQMKIPINATWDKIAQYEHAVWNYRFTKLHYFMIFRLTLAYYYQFKFHPNNPIYSNCALIYYLNSLKFSFSQQEIIILFIILALTEIQFIYQCIRSSHLSISWVHAVCWSTEMTWKF